MRLCHKLWFSNPNIFTTQCRKPEIFQTMNFVRSNNQSLKFQKFTSTGCKDIRIITFEFVAKTQFVYFYLWVRGACNMLKLYNIWSPKVCPSWSAWRRNCLKGLWNLQNSITPPPSFHGSVRLWSAFKIKCYLFKKCHQSYFSNL